MQVIEFRAANAADDTCAESTPGAIASPLLDRPIQHAAGVVAV